MNLYFAPMACSLATRIALYEAKADAEFVHVNLKSKRLADGSSYLDIAPLGQVPMIRTADGTFITENSAILQYVADAYPDASLAPRTANERARLQQWLGFIGTELHKIIFQPLLETQASSEVKAYARTKIPLRFGHLQSHLEKHDYLLNEFSVADAYLLAVLNWTAVTDIDLKQWPAVAAYRERLLGRPSVAKAVGEEWALFREEQAKATAQ
jgi:glutathione S-transferase